MNCVSVADLSHDIMSCFFFYRQGLNEAQSSSSHFLLDTVTLSTEANYAYTYVKYVSTDWQLLERASFFFFLESILTTNRTLTVQVCSLLLIS